MSLQVICAKPHMAAAATLLTTASANRKPKVLAGLRAERTGRQLMASSQRWEKLSTSRTMVAADRMSAAAVGSMLSLVCDSVRASARRLTQNHNSPETTAISAASQIMAEA